MARTGPTTLALPPFEGATRRLILAYLGVFFGLAILGWVLPSNLYRALFGHLSLVPWQVAHGAIWQVVTYIFVPMDILGTAFTLLFLWFIGSMLEDLRGSRWLLELFLSAAIGGAILASAISFTHILGLSPASSGSDPYAGIFGLLIAVYLLLGEQEFLLMFVVRIKAKYLMAIYILIDIARLLLHSDPFGALLHLCGAGCGYLYLRFASRRGLSYAVSEQFFALRNQYYRSKRRQAAKKFEVYMREQNREVHFDKNGKYVEPDDRDPNDKRWMN